MPGKYTLDVLQILATRVAGLFISLGGSIILARALGPEGRGEFVFALTLAATIAQIGNLGLHSSNTYLAARDTGLVGQLTVNSGWVTLWVTVASLGLLESARVLGWLPGFTLSLSLLTCGVGAATLVVFLGTNLLVGVNRVGLFNGLQVCTSVLNLVGIVIVALLGLGVASYLIVSLVAAGGVGVLAVAALLERRLPALHFDAGLFGRGVRYASKAYLSALLAFMMLRVSVFLVRTFLGPEGLGYYSIASQVSDTLGLFPASLALVLFPRLVRQDLGRYRFMLRNLLAVAVLMAVGCGAFELLAEPFVRVLFGVAFLPAVPILRWMLPGAFLLGTTTVVQQYVAAGGLPRRLLAILALGLASGVALGLLLIPRYGGTGAAMSLSISYAVIFLLELALAHRMSRSEAPTVAG